jgi:hypothetical protein
MSTLATTNIKHPSSASNNIVLDSAGAVGIGSTLSGNANNRLLVRSESASAITNVLLLNNGAANSNAGQGVRLNLSGISEVNSDIRYAYIEAATQTTGNDHYLAFGTNAPSVTPVERMRIDSSGRVGIDTTAPYSLLDLGTSLTGQKLSIYADATYRIGLGALPNEFRQYTHEGGFISWGHVSTSDQSTFTERMRLNSAGRLLIGTTVEIGTNENATQGIMLANEGTFLSARNSSSPNFFISKIGTGSDGDVLRFSRNGSQVGSISVSASATAYNTSSDYRLKENVTPVSDGITRLQQLKPSRFNFIVDPDKTVDGFLAHEAQAVVPECVTGTKDEVDDENNPVYQGIDQSKLVPLLTAALQEAIGRIETLEAEVSALKGA